MNDMILEKLNVSPKCDFCNKINGFDFVWITNSANHLVFDYKHSCNFFSDLEIRIIEKYEINLEDKAIGNEKKYLIEIKIKDVEKLLILRFIKLEEIFTNYDFHKMNYSGLIFNNYENINKNELNNLLNIVLNLKLTVKLELRRIYKQFNHDFIIYSPFSSYNLDEKIMLLYCSNCNNFYFVKNKKSITRHKSKFACKAKPYEFFIDDILFKEEGNIEEVYIPD